MSQMKQGEVILSHQIECHKGKLGALEGQQLVLVFLGTCAEGVIPDVVAHMETLGWFLADLFEVVAEIATPLLRKKQTLFKANSPHEGAEAAVRFARRQAMDMDGRVASIEVRVVRIGEVRADGATDHRRVGEGVLSWSEESHLTLDEAVAALAD